MDSVRNIIGKLWCSPTLMTWGSFLSRSIGFLLVLPIAVRTLGVDEIVIWYLFSAIISFQWILDLGFGSTSSRAIAYAMAGAASLSASAVPTPDKSLRSANLDLLSQLRTTMRWVYSLLAIVSLLVMGLVGTWALWKPVSGLPHAQSIWVAWMLILAMFPVGMYGNQYSAYLEGMNEIALVRRWDIAFSVLSNGFMALALLAGAGLLGMILCGQICAAARIAIYYKLVVQMDRRYVPPVREKRVDKGLLFELWAGAWRSGVGGIMSYGIAYAATFIIAHREKAEVAASYLISARLLDALLQLSQAPFYSKLPLLTRLRAAGQFVELVSVARRGMATGYWCFIGGFFALALFTDQVLGLIRSNATFAPPDLWCLMGLATFMHFYGAMHIQLYSTTNHIIWHIANTGSGAIFIGISWLLIGDIGTFAIPIGWLCGYLGFYSWYSAIHSYGSIGTGFLKFERKLMFPPLALLLIYCLYVVVSHSLQDWTWALK